MKARDRQTDRRTDGQDQHMMGPPSRKDGPIIIYPQAAGAFKAYTSSQKIFDFLASTCCVWVHFDTRLRLHLEKNSLKFHIK